VSRREFWQMLKRLKERGITIFTSTPYMDEAVLCDRIALIQNGVIMSSGTPEEIVNSFDKRLYEIKSTTIYALLKTLKSWENTYSCNTFGQSVHFAVNVSANGDKITREDIAAYLQSQGMTQFEIKECSATIEDCFIELMRKSNGNNN